jgi:hypothetical protein
MGYGSWGRLASGFTFWLTLVHSPIALAMVSELEQTVPRIVALTAIGAGQITAPCRALATVVFRDREARAATARNEKHSY